MSYLDDLKQLFIENEPVDPFWDNNSIAYNTAKYNWQERFLSVAQELKPNLDDLTQIHNHFSIYELMLLRKKFEQYSKSTEFESLVDEYVHDHLAEHLPTNEYMVQSTVGIRIVIPNQEKAGRLLSFHTGYWTGYDNSTYTIWTPTTNAFDSNTMQVLSWEDTKKVLFEFHENEYPLEKIQSMCEEVCYPVNINYGQAWLFNQGHLHGNINNVTGVTRTSFDTRVITKGADFNYRRAGSFYRFPGTSMQANLDKLNLNGRWAVFVDQNSHYIYPTPNFMIREFLISYGRNLNLSVTDWHNEYRYCQWSPHFQYFIEQKTFSGIIVPSIYAFQQFDTDKERLLSTFESAIENEVQILFADENIVLNDSQDLDKIKKLFAFISNE